MKEAVIFFQSNGKGEVERAVKCAIRWNQGRVVVIGDKRYEPDADFLDVRKVSQDFCDLDSKYIHQSPNPESFEKVCLKRWFAINRAFDILGLERAFCSDTDCLIFCDPFSDPRFEDCDLSLSFHHEVGMATAGMSMHTKKSLSIYCDFVLNRFFENGRKLYGSNDLGAWSDLVLHDEAGKQLRLSDSNSVVDGCIWDHHLGVTEGFKRAPDGGKLISFHNGQPYSVRHDGEVVRLCGLHCWSKYRTRIQAYLDASEASLEWAK